ncbi:MAG: HEAT repeat domain-containing protein, partial [Gemmatimonadetes bacterium]|nr:HEAT repeat domain-containing protein [Gemmatimonadota bacterium]
SMARFLVTLVAFMGLQAVALALFALVLRRHRDRTPVRRSQLWARWSPALMDVLMDAAAPERLWAKVDVNDGAEFVEFLLEYGRRVEGRDNARIRRLARPYLPAIADRTRSRSPETRARTLQALGELDLDRWSDALVAGLADPSPSVALVAAATLARERAVDRLPQVLERLDRFAGWRPDYLASVLATFGPGGATALREALEDSTNAHVRAAVANALAHLNDAEAAGAACQVLEAGPDPELGAACLRLLERVGTEEHRSGALRYVDDESFALRLSAARALGRTGGAQDHARLREMVLSDPSPWVALNAGRALLEAGGRMELRELAGRDHSRSRVARQALAEAR